MKRARIFSILVFAITFSGCDGLSEKDKMEMIARCDSEARKRFFEGVKSYVNGYVSVELETHYSFFDKRCYTYTKESIRSPTYSSFTDTLFDGLTKKELLKAMCSSVDGNGKNVCVDGGVSSGPLAVDGIKDARGLVSFDEGRKIIEERMNRP